MSNTDDPVNKMLENLRTYLASKLTDPRANRNTTDFPYVQIGNTLRDEHDIEYPYISIRAIGPAIRRKTMGDKSANAAAGQGAGLVVASEIRIIIFTDLPRGNEKGEYGGKSGSHLLRFIASDVLTHTQKEPALSDLMTTYDFLSLEAVGGQGDLPPADDSNELMYPIIYEAEFEWRY